MANEKRLVDAEAIARKLKNAHCAECHVVRKVQCSACWVEDVLELLDDEAVEVVHGRWETVSSMLGYLCCSQCKDVYIWDTWLEDGKWNYCPNCGADMRVRKDNG